MMALEWDSNTYKQFGVEEPKDGTQALAVLLEAIEAVIEQYPELKKKGS
jgi:hypothetical protein